MKRHAPQQGSGRRPDRGRSKRQSRHGELPVAPLIRELSRVQANSRLINLAAQAVILLSTQPVVWLDKDAPGGGFHPA